jgi:hypothetical protein
MIAHGDDTAARIEECARIVTAFLDVGRVRGTSKRSAHFFGECGEEVPIDLETNGIVTRSRSFHEDRSGLS